jgi:GxxExxY protein
VLVRIVAPGSPIRTAVTHDPSPPQPRRLPTSGLPHSPPSCVPSGPSLACLCHELALRGIPFRRQVPVSLSYKGLSLECAYRMDLLVDTQILVELKFVERLLPVHEAQALTYLRLTGLMLVNFNVPVLRLGLRRLTNNVLTSVAHR